MTQATVSSHHIADLIGLVLMEQGKLIGGDLFERGKTLLDSVLPPEAKAGTLSETQKKTAALDWLRNKNPEVKYLRDTFAQIKVPAPVEMNLRQVKDEKRASPVSMSKEGWVKPNKSEAVLLTLANAITGQLAILKDHNVLSTRMQKDMFRQIELALSAEASLQRETVQPQPKAIIASSSSRKPASARAHTQALQKIREVHYPNVNYSEAMRLPVTRDKDIDSTVRAIYSLAKSSQCVQKPSQFSWHSEAHQAKRLLQVTLGYEELVALGNLIEGMVPDSCTYNESGLEVDVNKIVRHKDIGSHADIAVHFAKPVSGRVM